MNNQVDQPSVPGADDNDESRAIVPSQSVRDSTLATSAAASSTPPANRDSDENSERSECDADSPVESAKSADILRDEAILRERQQMLKVFQSDYAAWEFNQLLMQGLEGDKNNTSIRTDYLDTDARHQALAKVVQMYNDEKQREKTVAHENENVEIVNLVQARNVNEGVKFGKCGEESTRLSSVASSLEQFADILFTPGMRYRGHIRIPGFKEPSTGEAPALSNEEGGNAIDNVNSASSTQRPALRSRTSPRRHFQPERKLDDTYELIVLNRGKDVLGNAFILALHRAYDDEQCVHIKWRIDGDDIGNGKEDFKVLKIEYEDGETVCKGRWNPIDHRFEGNVGQRLHANDGAFHSRSEVTHVFTLHPCTDAFPLGMHSEVAELLIVQRQNFSEESLKKTTENDAIMTDEASGADGGPPSHSVDDGNPKTDKIELMQLQGLLSIFRDVNKHPFGDDEIMGMFFKLQRVRWIDVLRAQSLYSEQMCAELRRRAAVLDAAHFETCEQRHMFIKEWKEARMDLAGAHSIWSDCDRLAKNICSLAFAFDFTSLRDSGVVALEVLRHRLMSTYYCFEGAYRRAESRLATGDLRRYEISHNSLQLGLDGVAYVLDSDRNNDDEEKEDVIKDAIIYKLPCCHCFHGQCIKQWLHDNFSCPVCRSVLTKADKHQPMCDQGSINKA
ncbi:hypothetical protein ACHAWX_002034 [Stephanocyclus meneghinianus]